MFDFKFDWSRELECGVKLLDEQHQELFRIGRDIEQLLIHGCENITNTQLLNIVCSLRDYASYHVHTKEMLMKKYKYPKYISNCKSLYILRDNIISIDMSALGKDPQRTLSQIKDDLQTFLFDHILVEGKELGRFLNSCGLY